MPGPIRREFGLIRNRLDNAIKKVKEKTRKIIDVKSFPSHAELLKALDSAHTEILKDITLLQGPKSEILDVHTRWDQLITELSNSPDEQKTEQDLKTEAEAIDYPKLEEATQLLNTLRANERDIVEAKLTALKHAHEESAEGDESLATEHPTQGAVTTPSRTFQLTPFDDSRQSERKTTTYPDNDGPSTEEEPRLPRQQLPSFDGDRTQWRRFRDIFLATVHNRKNLAPIRKMEYLATTLKGPALRLIDGFPIEGASYDAAWSALVTEYGDETTLRLRLHSDLRHLPHAGESVEGATILLREARRISRMLKQLGENTDSPENAAIIEEKLPFWLLKGAVKRRKENPSWKTDDLFKFLDEKIGTRRAIDEVEKTNKRNTPKKTTVAATRAIPTHERESQRHKTAPRPLKDRQEARQPRECTLCSHGSHLPSQCPNYKTPALRKQRLRELKRCPKCSSKSHFDEKECRSRTSCRICNEKNHIAMLCEQGPGGKKAEAKAAVMATTLAELRSGTKEIVLMTKTVELSNPDDPTITQNGLVFMDFGAEKSFVTNQMAQHLRLRPRGHAVLAIATITGTEEVSTQIFHIAIRQNDGSHTTVQVHGINKISTKLTTIQNEAELDKSTPKRRKKEPDVLLGSDVLQKFCTVGQTLPSGLSALDTTLGRVAYGSLTVAATATNDHSQDLLEKLWALDAIGINEEPTENDDELAQQFFTETIQRDASGRYMVKWPYKTRDPKLPDNWKIALAMLMHVVKRLAQKPELLARYDNVIKEQLKEGIIEVACDPPQGLLHFLPHHEIIREDKKSTKLRIVFNASAGRKGESLNANLYRGPTYMPKIAEMIIAFRSFKIVVSADIRKAYLQIGLQEEDRDVCRFFWLRDINKPPTKDNIIAYRFCRVPFGIISSSFLLAAVLRLHLSHEASDVAQQMLRYTYADNIIIYGDTTEEATYRCKAAKDIFSQAQMQLTQFLSNNQDINEKFADDKDSFGKFLGCEWDTTRDILTIKVSQADHPATKRGALQLAASIYDPTGMISPALVSIKAFIQILWKKSYKWDDPLHTEDLAQWEIEKNQLQGQMISFPRLALSSRKGLTLHIFSDASQIAYGAAAYLTNENSSTLILAKSRICPVKAVTIPRLELIGTTIGAKLKRFLDGMEDLNIEKSILWTDSKVALSWLHSSNRTLPRFIANRVKIVKDANFTEIRYIPTNENPADLLSRGVPITELQNSQLWWHGPGYLSKPDEWPPTPEFTNIDDTDGDDDKYVAAFATTIAPDQQRPLIDESRFSTWRKMVRTTAFVIRFLTKARKTPGTWSFPWLSPAEIQQAEKILIRQAQQLNPPDRKTVHGLNIIRHSDGFLRCLGRMAHSEDETTKKPLYMPRHSRITRLIAEDVHERLLHAGRDHCLAELRTKIWVPQGRQLIRSVVNSCQSCKRDKAKPFRLPDFPDLPAERIRRCTPFENTGVDYLGPLSVRHIHGTDKAWICLFTCLATRAVHLEVVPSLTAASFIKAIRRFISRRGQPKTFFSDNATTFTLAENVTKEAWNKMVEDEEAQLYVSSHKIHWKFATQASPWSGGVYERMIGITKKALHRAVRRRILQMEELTTIITEIEAVLNTRPLLYVHDENPRTLRPLDFLSPLVKPGAPIENLSDDEDNEAYIEKQTTKTELIKSWHESTKLLDRFWKTFYTDYLPTLRERLQRSHPHSRSVTNRNPKTGEVVLLGENDVPRGRWRLATIVKTVPSTTDGAIRAASIRMSNGRILQRPICALYPLEITGDDEGSLQAANTPTHDEEPREALEREPLTVDTDNKKAATARPEHDARKRYNLRDRPKKTNIFWLLIALTLAPANALSCDKWQLLDDHKPVRLDECLQNGYAIFQPDKGEYCYQPINCGSKSIRKQNHNKGYKCGEACDCPHNAVCSYYDGQITANSTMKADFTRHLIENMEPPEICALTPQPRCDPKPRTANILQITLYDGTSHPVRALQITTKASLEIVCFGDGETNGTPRFCEHHACTSGSKKLCTVDERELLLLTSPDGTVAIKQWQTTDLTFYGHLPDNNQCQECHSTCAPGGVEVSTPDDISTIETCVSVTCNHAEKKGNKQRVQLPEGVVSAPYDPEVRFYKHGRVVASNKLKCKPALLCDSITCTICWENISNPICMQKTLITLSACLIALLMCILNQVIQLITLIIKSIWRVCRCSKTIIQSGLRALPRQSHRFKKPVIILSIINIIAPTHLLVSQAQACVDVISMQAKDASCSRQDKGGETCRIDSTMRFSSPAYGQSICITLLTSKGQAAGHIEIKMKELVATCSRENLFHTIEHTVEVASMRRCPQSGSCVGNRCASLKPNDEIPELGEAQHFPGSNRCTDAASGWASGCFYFEPGCLFYRPHARPVTDRLYTIFECKWILEAQLELLYQRQGKVKTIPIRLRPGMTSEYIGNIKLQFEQATYPSMPTLTHKFISDGTRAAIVPEGAIDHLRALTCQTARIEDCVLKPDICDCTPTKDFMNCLCNDGHLVEKVISENALPSLNESTWLRQENGEIIIGLQEATQSLLLEVHDLEVRTVADNSKCTFNQIAFQGCHSCQVGARLQFTCRTNFGSATGILKCPDLFEIPILCEEKGIDQDIYVHIQSTVIDAQCSIACPDSTAEINIHGSFRAIIENSAYNAPMFALNSIPIHIERAISLINANPIFAGICYLAAFTIGFLLMTRSFVWGVWRNRRRQHND